MALWITNNKDTTHNNNKTIPIWAFPYWAMIIHRSMLVCFVAVSLQLEMTSAKQTTCPQNLVACMKTLASASWTHLNLTSASQMALSGLSWQFCSLWQATANGNSNGNGNLNIAACGNNSRTSSWDCSLKMEKTVKSILVLCVTTPLWNASLQARTPMKAAWRSHCKLVTDPVDQGHSTLVTPHQNHHGLYNDLGGNFDTMVVVTKAAKWETTILPHAPQPHKRRQTCKQSLT